MCMTFFKFFLCSYSRPNKNLKSGDFQHIRNTFKSTLLLTLRVVETDPTFAPLRLLLWYSKRLFGLSIVKVDQG